MCIIKVMGTESGFHKFQVRVKKALGMNVILCDSCKWDWRGACHNPARPNATYCDEYKNKAK
jgi:hypothetical protein